MLSLSSFTNHSLQRELLYLNIFGSQHYHAEAVVTFHHNPTSSAQPHLVTVDSGVQEKIAAGRHARIKFSGRPSSDDDDLPFDVTGVRATSQLGKVRK